MPRKTIRRTLRDRATGFLADWSLPRQMAGGDPLRDAAKSEASRSLRPRLGAGRYRGHQHLSVLRRRL